MTSRRGFLASLGAFALDPERLLWRPGAKLISIPKPRPDTYLQREIWEGGLKRTYINGVLVDCIVQRPDEAWAVWEPGVQWDSLMSGKLLSKRMDVTRIEKFSGGIAGQWLTERGVIPARALP